MEQETPITTPFRTGFRYGIILGLISIAYFLFISITGSAPNQSWSWWLGLLLDGGLLFLAHQYFKDNGEGWMTYGQGMGISFYTGLFSSLIRGIFLVVFLHIIDVDYARQLADMQRDAMEKQNMTQAQIDAAMVFVEKFSQPGWLFLFSLLGGVIGMVLIGLIISIITRKRNPMNIE